MVKRRGEGVSTRAPSGQTWRRGRGSVHEREAIAGGREDGHIPIMFEARPPPVSCRRAARFSPALSLLSEPSHSFPFSLGIAPGGDIDPAKTYSFRRATVDGSCVFLQKRAPPPSVRSASPSSRDEGQASWGGEGGVEGGRVSFATFFALKGGPEKKGSRAAQGKEGLALVEGWWWWWRVGIVGWWGRRPPKSHHQAANAVPFAHSKKGQPPQTLITMLLVCCEITIRQCQLETSFVVFFLLFLVFAGRKNASSCAIRSLTTFFSLAVGVGVGVDRLPVALCKASPLPKGAWPISSPKGQPLHN